jgi:ribokinase
MVGAVGADPFGDTMLKSLESDGIDVQRVRKLLDEKTGTATILVEQETGENRILFTPGANFALRKGDDLVGKQGYGDVALFQLETPLDVVSVQIPLCNF